MRQLHLIAAPRQIVILRALQLGDLLCTVPAFRALRAAFPAARIALVGLPWASAFVRRFPHYLDEFIEFPGWPGLPEREPEVERIPAFLRCVQRRHYDLALQMQGAGEITNPLVMLFGARQAAGFYRTGQYRPQADLFTPYPEGEHEIHIFLRLVERLGIPGQGVDLEFPLSEEEQDTFAHFQARYGLAEGGYVCLHPGARDPRRRWSPEKFAAVGDGLAAQGYRILVTGSAAEKDLAAAVTAGMRFPALDLSGLTDLGTLAQVIARAGLLLSNDTGVSHIAAAMQTPSLILFNASDPNRWRPLNHQIHRVVLDAHRVSPGEVLSEAGALLKEKRFDAIETR